MANQSTEQQPELSWLPDFCSIQLVFTSMVFAELIILIESLLPMRLATDWWSHLTLGSVFVQWIALVSNTILCALRPFLQKMRASSAFILAFQVVPVMTALSSVAFYALDKMIQMGMISQQVSFEQFVLGNSLIATLVSAAIFRYLYMQTLWKRRMESEARSRFEALQARIRPHFLFNSLNTIASLVRQDPQQAEDAVLDLSDLFRSAVGGQKESILLSQELENSKKYLELEKLRMGERLKVQWIDERNTEDPMIPPFIIQPLVENAIYHGIQNLVDGGLLEVQITVVGKHVQVRIKNPFQGESDHDGSQQALKNIKERLNYIYAKDGYLKCSRDEQFFVAELRVPA